MKALPSKIWNKTRVIIPTTLIQHSMEVLGRAIRPAKEIKRIQIVKEVKLLLMADIILYTENPKYSTNQNFKLINEFSKVARYKINIKNCLC